MGADGVARRNWELLHANAQAGAVAAVMAPTCWPVGALGVTDVASRRRCTDGRVVTTSRVGLQVGLVDQSRRRGAGSIPYREPSPGTVARWFP